MNKLKQLAFIGFTSSGDIAQVNQMSISPKSEADLNSAKNIVSAFLCDDSTVVKVVLCKNKDLTFTSDDIERVMPNLTQALTSQVSVNDVAESNNLHTEVKGYRVSSFECECPNCEEAVQLPDDGSRSGASFEHTCPHCRAKFPVRCDY
ncbi:hypothetical protein [Vibrio fluvialis]|uniref:hypothetical protein n=1 Tax=Vibrio fluvialis TaxID=676 RepID=UPI0023A9B434|nr:hypothetical protein [Vibrio fluvialis]MDE5179123.1 hypothetical protein [Vibrio fluvialis]